MRIYNSPLIKIPYRRYTLIRGIIRFQKLKKIFSLKILDEKSISKMTYQDLEYVKQYDIDLFKKISKYIYNINIKRIREKNVIQIAFFCPDSAIWSCDRLYHLFEGDRRFEPYIIVPGFNNGTKTTIQEIYDETLKYFTRCGYNTIGVFNGKSGNTWNELKIPDIIIHLTPYPNILPVEYNIFHVPLSCLNIYIPYTIAAVDDYWLFNIPGPQLSWIWFCETKCCNEMIRSHALLGAENVVVSGHPKMDALLNQPCSTNLTRIWKCLSGKKPSDIKKIIYAPHHTIYNNSIKFSTFHENLYDIYMFAKESAETMSWIIKPHPLLKKASIENGLFKSEKEFDEYMDMWDALPNARTVRNGQYDNIFLTSDAMITDCVSYITEYLCVNKPLIILRRPEQKYNKWGKMILTAAYSVPGNEIRLIQNIVNKVVIQGEDTLREKREELINQHISIPDKYDNNETSISKYIYKYITSYFQ